MLQVLLSEGRPLLADGATGTNLFAMGLASGDSPELWNAEHPDRIQSLHQAFVDAGSDIILTNSFGGNRRRLMLHGLETRARELNRLAAQNARKVADSAGRPVVVGRVGRAHGRPSRSAWTIERRGSDRGFCRADRGPARRRRRRRLDRDHVSARGNACGGGRGRQVRYAVCGDRKLRHGRAHHDGRRPLRVQRGCRGFRPGAHRIWRELRGRRLRSPGRHPRNEVGRSSDRQGERRRAAVARGGDPLFGHAGTDGDLCRTRRRLRRAHCWRLLRQQPGPCRGDAARSRRPPSRPAPDLGAIVAALGALVAPPAGEAAARTRRREKA